MRALGATAGTALLASLVGCAGFANTATSTATSGVAFAGSVHGGQQPVSGAKIFLYGASTTGYGALSTSLLRPGTGIQTDQYGNQYATTDGSGNFGFNSYVCPTPTTQVFLLALGGNPGLAGTVNNTAISEIAAIGNCGNINSSSFFTINEVTTVAFVTALQQYMTSYNRVGAPTTNAQGIAISFALAQDLASTSTGFANRVNVAGTGNVPRAKINTLANALSPCVNSASNGSTACANLFAAVTPTGGTTPGETVGAMLMIAQNPGNNVAGINAQTTPAAPFQPGVTATPNDWTLAITYSGGGLTAPGNVVIDAFGDAFMGNSPSTAGVSGTDSIVGFGPNGAVLTGAGYTAGIHAPGALAFDNLGNLWSNNAASGSSPDQVAKQNSTGGLLFNFNDSTLSGLQGLAIDSSNNAWTVSQNLNSIVRINAANGRTLAPVTATGFSFPTGVGIDGSGVLFAAGTGSNNVLKFTSTGAQTGLFTSSRYAGPINISIDNSDNVWSIQNGTSAIVEVNGATGVAVAPPATQATLSNAFVLAIDGAGGAWYANCRVCSSTSNGSPDNLVHVLPGGAQSTGSADGYQDNKLSRVGTAAIDGSGNVWVTNNLGGTVTEFVGVAAPVVTPLAVASATNKLGVRP